MFVKASAQLHPLQPLSLKTTISEKPQMKTKALHLLESTNRCSHSAEHTHSICSHIHMLKHVQKQTPACNRANRQAHRKYAVRLKGLRRYCRYVCIHPLHAHSQMSIESYSLLHAHRSVGLLSPYCKSHRCIYNSAWTLQYLRNSQIWHIPSPDSGKALVFVVKVQWNVIPGLFKWTHSQTSRAEKYIHFSEHANSSIYLYNQRWYPN